MDLKTASIKFPVELLKMHCSFCVNTFFSEKGLVVNIKYSQFQLRINLNISSLWVNWLIYFFPGSKKEKKFFVLHIAISQSLHEVLRLIKYVPYTVCEDEVDQTSFLFYEVYKDWLIEIICNSLEKGTRKSIFILSSSAFLQRKYQSYFEER